MSPLKLIRHAFAGRIMEEVVIARSATTVFGVSCPTDPGRAAYRA